MIASAFPGQFGYTELLNLDLRDLMFWFRQAQKKMVQDQLKRIQAARLAMAENSSYERVCNDLEIQIHELEHGKEKVVQDNWDFLREKGRG
ncbi:MAG: hypothetical protein EOM12_03770 [Verrucomicrobiae bacterium]|nr:hypothetical protein [Verrucomicrobiae bacterium]